MRSALWQAIDILGPDADPADFAILWTVICDLTWERFPKAWDDPAWAAADGPERVRMILAAAPDSAYIADGTEPEAVRRRLGLARPASPKAPADDR